MMTHSRILWACRRGMLELDLILGAYAQNRYPSTSVENQQAFQALLDCQDQELFEWLVHQVQAPEVHQAMIRHVLNAREQG